MVPIIFIHGVIRSTDDYEPIKRFLRMHGFTKFYDFSYKERFGQVSIEELAKRLDRFVTANVKEKEFDIIGISQGGIIARYYIMMSKIKRVRRCVTICAPHKGSLTAYVSGRFADLRPGSKLLRALARSRDQTKYYALYTPFDLMVMPGTNAICERAVENRRVNAPLHHLAFGSKATLEFILHALRTTSKRS
jgi:triacylglycerol esterase/lipase EstA (alpha/beta hydrolase family)